MTVVSSLRELIRDLVSRVSDNKLVLKTELKLDYRDMNAHTRGVKSLARSGHVLVATAGSGNIGDQAMLESYLDNVSGDVLVVLQAPGSLAVADRHVGRVSTVVLPRLFQGNPIVRLRDRRALTKEVSRREYFSVIGADIMDGGYGRRQAALRFGLLRAAGSSGAMATLLGFSWNGRPDAFVLKCAARAGKFSRLCVRDPQSLARLEADGVGPLYQVADMVFAHRGAAVTDVARDWIVEQESEHRPIVVVNASGLLSKNRELLAEYHRVVAHLLDQGCSVLILPHVIREGDDDLQPCRRLFEAYREHPYVFLVESLLTPSEVSRIVSSAVAVMTARMHLSILALSKGVPVTVLSTQGKVQGLLEMFELADCELEVESGMGGKAADALDWFLGSEEARLRVNRNLDWVRDLAMENFALMIDRD